MKPWVAALLLWQIKVTWALTGNPLLEADRDRETRGNLRSGEIVQIPLANGKFTAVLDPVQTSRMEGGAILLPEAGYGPASHPTLSFQRRFLPRHGWSTLTLQLPVLEPEASWPEYWQLLPEASARVQAAVNWWRQQGVENLVLIGHGFGAWAAAGYLAGQPDRALRAAVLIGMGWPRQRLDEVRPLLAKIQVPVFDIQAGQDRGEVLATRLQRHLLFKDNPGFRQLEIRGAGHHLQGWAQILGKRILGWLRQVAPGTTLQVR